MLFAWNQHLTSLSHAALLEIAQKDDTGALLTLDALEWALENSLVYLRGLPLRPEHRVRLSSLESQQRKKLREVRDLSLSTLKQRNGVLGFLHSVESATRPDSIPSTEDIVESEGYQEAVKQAETLLPGESTRSEGTITLKTPDGTSLDFRETYSVEKQVCEYNESTGRNEAEVTVRYGLSRMDDGAIAETLAVPGTVELGLMSLNSAKQELRNFSFEGNQEFSVVCPDLDPSQKAQAQAAESFPAHARNLLDRAIDQSSGRDKTTLKELKELANQLENLQREFREITEKYGDKIRNNSKKIQKTLGQWKSKAQKVKALPPVRPQKSDLAARNTERNRSMDQRRGTLWAESLGLGKSELTQGLWDFLENLASSGSARDQVLNARAKKPKKIQKSPSPPVVSSRRPISDKEREKILAFARKALDRKIRYTNVDSPGRLGPDSYDCSGFVGKAYEDAGLGFTTPSEAIPNVETLATDSEVFEHIPTDEALPGDLVLHLKTDGVQSNHVGIYTGGGEGDLLEISALKRGGDAMKNISDPDFRTSVVEHPGS